MPSKSVRSEIARIALSRDGVREEGGNNCGLKVREYQSATWLAPAAWPWCAAFVDWVILHWFNGLASPRDVLEALRVQRSNSESEAAAWEKWRPRTAGAFDLIRWAKESGLKVLPNTAAVEAGDIVVFEMSHCGIVTADHARTTALIRTVEGNTGPAGLRDAESGDGVFQKKRPRSLVRAFIRMERAA